MLVKSASPDAMIVCSMDNVTNVFGVINICVGLVVQKTFLKVSTFPRKGKRWSIFAISA